MTPTQPTERAMSAMNELVERHFVFAPHEARLAEIARIIDRHTDSMAEELAEALRMILDDIETDYIAQHSAKADRRRRGYERDLKALLAKYDAQKGKP
jgi:hypothetical protein